jgi:hypothetical protein
VTTILITGADDRKNHSLLGSTDVKFNQVVPDGFIVSFYTTTMETFTFSSSVADFLNVSGIYSKKIVLGGTPGLFFQFAYEAKRKAFRLDVSQNQAEASHSDEGGTRPTNGATEDTLASFKAAQHTDSQALLAKLTLGATEDTIAAFKVAQHTDSQALLAKLTLGAKEETLAALRVDQHVDLQALLTKLTLLTAGTEETDHSGSIPTANTAKVIMSANPARKYFELQNLDAAATLWFRKDGTAAAINAPGNLSLAPGGFYSGQAVGAVSAISALAGHKYTALEANPK